MSLEDPVARREYMRAYRAANLERMREYERDYREKNSGPGTIRFDPLDGGGRHNSTNVVPAWRTAEYWAA